jgi:hypothetical protein
MFNEYKFNCKYYNRVSIPRNNFNGSYVGCPPIMTENCNHPLAGKSKEVTSKTCNENNDFCPYKELNNN